MKRKGNFSSNIAERMNSIISNKEMPSIDNYYDDDGVPQAHLDGEPQEDFVYDYYIDRAIEPPWFEDYKQRKYGIPVNWQYVSSSLQDGRTKDETAYLIRKYFREHGTLEGCPYNYNKTF